MSLSSALSIAQNSLLNTQRQVNVVSRNVADANNPDYARRSAIINGMAPGSRVAEIRRSANEALFRENLTALSGFSAQSTIVSGLDHLSLSVNGVDQTGSVAAALGDFQRALQFYAATPSNRTLGEAAVESARHVVRSFNQGTAEIQKFRADMDGQIAFSVDELNHLLAEFETNNIDITNGKRAGRDVNDALDKRDSLLKSISEIIPISTINRDDGDMMIVTADGATLFEKIPRVVSFTSTNAYDAGTVGSGIRIDGVPVSTGIGGNTTASGSLAAKLQLRDTVSAGMQLQLDEMARALNDAVPGLVTYAGNTTDPGFAGRIVLNAFIDPSVGGNPELLRDGITGSILQDSNPSVPPDPPFAGFSDLLLGYLSEMDAPRTFETASGAPASFSLMDYSADAISWLEANRKEASSGAETKTALLMRTSSALSNNTGVNVDEEMALLLELEHSYAASARLLQIIDNMLTSLLEATR